MASILIGTGKDCTRANYIPSPKKILTLSSGDLTRARRLNAISITTPIPNTSYSQRPANYSQLQSSLYANRVRVPLNIFFGQNFQ